MIYGRVSERSLSLDKQARTQFSDGESSSASESAPLCTCNSDSGLHHVCQQPLGQSQEEEEEALGRMREAGRERRLEPFSSWSRVVCGRAGICAHILFEGKISTLLTCSDSN